MGFLIEVFSSDFMVMLVIVMEFLDLVLVSAQSEVGFGYDVVIIFNLLFDGKVVVVVGVL